MVHSLASTERCYSIQFYYPLCSVMGTSFVIILLPESLKYDRLLLVTHAYSHQRMCGAIPPLPNTSLCHGT